MIPPIHRAEILPNQKFRMPVRNLINDFDTFDEAAKFYYNHSEETDNECIQCEFKDKCLHKYKDGGKCYWDKKIMHTIVKELAI